MDKMTSIELDISEKKLRELNQVSIYIGTPSFKDLILNYIDRGLSLDKAKMEATRQATLERQRQINEISRLVKEVCPHCQKEISVVETSSYSRWRGEYLGVCLNNECPYFIKSWEVMKEQGNHAGYRYYKDLHGSSGPLAVGPVEMRCLLDG